MINLLLIFFLAIPYSDLDPAFLGWKAGSCRLCSENSVTQEYKALASNTPNVFSSLAGNVTLAQVCYSDLDVHLMYTPWATGSTFWYGFTSYLYTVPYVGAWLISRPPSLTNLAEWDYLGDCTPSDGFSKFIKSTASARCGNHLPNDDYHCRPDTLPFDIYSSPSRVIQRTSRTHTIWAADSKGFMRAETYIADASGSVPIPIPTPTPRPAQTKNVFECAKAKFMTKFPFDFFALPGDGSPGCLKTNFLGHENSICNEVKPIFEILRIGGAITFAILFYLFL